jgi:CRP/FNR family cyclic AMP-dependent transcriptional regulator
MSRTTAKQERLAAVPVFAACSPAELALVERVADEVHVSAGERVIREGGVGVEFFVIETGQATVRRGGKDVATLGPGAYFGELALLDAPIRDAEVVAATDMDLIVIAVGALLDDVPSLCRALLRGMARRLRDADLRPR